MSSASVKANTSAVGGFIGVTKKGVTLTNVQFTGNVTGLSQVGGFVGVASNTAVSVTDGLMTGTVQAKITTGESSVGGICGFMTETYANVTATRCLITGTITYVADTTGCGEQIGNLANGIYTATSVYATTDCCATKSEVGAQVGTANITGGGRFSEEQLLGDVASTNASGLFDESTWTTQVISHPIPTAFHWYYSDTTKTEFVIKNEVEFFDFAKVSQTDNFAGKTICLADNIVVNEGTAEEMLARATGSDTTNDPIAWTPIGTLSKPFAGIFDGQNYTISGIFIYSSTTDLQGLFAYVGDNDGDCQIKNFTLNNTYIHGEDNTGSIVAAQREKATFENLTSNAVIKGVTKVGGIIGEVHATVDGTTITNCTFNGSINATDNNSGGMIGLTSGLKDSGEFSITLNNCTFGQDGSIEGTQVGGMIGGIGSQYNKVTLTSCISKGTITAQTGNGIAGGLIGKVAATKKDIDTGTRMNSCTITATLTASKKVGKYVGDIVSSYASYVFLNNLVLTDEANAVEDGNIIE